MGRRHEVNHFRDLSEKHEMIISVKTFVKYFVEAIINALNNDKLVIDEADPIFTDVNYEEGYCYRTKLTNTTLVQNLNFLDTGRIVSTY